MSGYRLKHATMRGGMYVVQTATPIKPYVCPRCMALEPRIATHEWKTHHIELDENGYGIVSLGVLEILQRNQMGGFTLINEVKDPPHQGVGEVMTLDGKPVRPSLAGATLLERKADG